MTREILPTILSQVMHLHDLRNPMINTVLYKLEEIQSDIAYDRSDEGDPNNLAVHRIREAVLIETIQEMYLAAIETGHGDLEAAIEEYLLRCGLTIDVNVERLDDEARAINAKVVITSPTGEVLMQARSEHIRYREW